jgi:heat shock protein HslJ
VATQLSGSDNRYNSPKPVRLALPHGGETYMSCVKGTTTGLFALFLVVLLTGCNQPDDSTGPSQYPADMSGTEWVLDVLNGQPPIKDSVLTLNFDSRHFEGFAGCNWYGGSYTATATTLGFSEIGGTAQKCSLPVGIMQQEEAYLNGLRQVATYRVIGDRLELGHSTGDPILVFERKK